MLATLAPVLSGVSVAPVTSSYYSIATQTVGSGGASSITFSSIPSTYTHLQLRMLARCAGGTSGGTFAQLNFNSDTGSNYAYHLLQGNGSSTAAFGTGNQTIAISERFPLASDGSSSVFGTSIVDILDYVNTSKYKTVRSLGGFDANGSGFVNLDSDLWMNTSAINRIDLTMYGGNFAQYSSFALYGVK
jgi:hypothetical protein